MTHSSLFSGIGGFDLAAEWMGWENTFHCEINHFCQRILKHYWPNAISYEDIKSADFTVHRGTIDVLSGGFPCQDISISGQGIGIFGTRSGLWAEYYRAICEILPGCVVIENSPQLIRKGFEKVLSDLSDIGYNAEWEIISASDVGMPHIRKRLWVVAYPSVQRRPGVLHMLKRSIVEKNRQTNPLDTQSHPFLRFEERYSQPAVFGMDDGISKRMDIVKWLGAFGNAVVPQVVYEIFKVIEKMTEYDNTRSDLHMDGK